MNIADPASEGWNVQVVLAAMMASPDLPLIDVLRSHFPGQDNEYYKLLPSVRNVVWQFAGSGTRKTDTLLDRLSFTWKFLRQADLAIYKLKKSEIHRAGGVQQVEGTFRDLLTTSLDRPLPLREPLLNALTRWLRLGADGRYLYHYFCLRSPSARGRLPEPFGNLASTKNPELTRTAIWWCLRARKEKYIEATPNEPVRIAFGFVTSEILKDLKKFCGDDIETIPSIYADIEQEVNAWHQYSRLESADGAPESVGSQTDLARAFIKLNDLNAKLHIDKSGGGAISDARIQELEARIRQYAEENQALEARNRALESAKAVPTSARIDSEPDSGAFAELREVLKTLDSKYAFDTLNLVQLGEDTHLTLRSFAAHLFYALRKRGFSEYPKEDEFALSYEDSGLYECDGFEVQPAEIVRVRVSRKGWALRARSRWLPVRKARVIRVDSGSGEAV